MAKRDKYNPDYKRLYPGIEITPEVMKVLKSSDRKMKYVEIELKHGVFCQDTGEFTPSREDSWERLCDDGQMEFTSLDPAPEEITVHNDEIDRLCKALKQLTAEEYALIHALFFDGLSEHDYARRLHIPRMTIHNKKIRIQEKLKKIMEN